MDNRDHVHAAWLLPIACIAFGGGVFMGMRFAFTCANEAWQSSLVKSGKAEFYLDAENNRQWRFK